MKILSTESNQRLVDINLFQHNFYKSITARGGEEIRSGSGGSEQIEGLSGNEQDTAKQPLSKKKRYHRHTAHQIHEMESYEL